jgi:hypothetical protein
MICDWDEVKMCEDDGDWSFASAEELKVRKKKE